VIDLTFRQPSPQGLGKVLFQHVSDLIQRWLTYAGAVRLSSSKPLGRDGPRQETHGGALIPRHAHILLPSVATASRGSREFAGVLGLLRRTVPIAHSLRGPPARNSRPDELDELNRTRDR
jgi:hypothetical protein